MLSYRSPKLLAIQAFVKEEKSEAFYCNVQQDVILVCCTKSPQLVAHTNHELIRCQKWRTLELGIVEAQI